MATSDAISNIIDTCDDLGEVDLSGVALETGESCLLNVSHMDLDEHVAMQPSAIAYYGSLFKDASRKLSTYKRQYNRWKKKKMAEARVALQNSSRAASSILSSDIEARFIVDNEPEIEKWEKGLDKLQRECDTLEIWFEAWKQKSFSISQYAGITEDERWNSSSSIKGSQKSKTKKTKDTDRGIDRVRDMIKQRQQDQNETTS